MSPEKPCMSQGESCVTQGSHECLIRVMCDSGGGGGGGGVMNVSGEVMYVSVRVMCDSGELCMHQGKSCMP